MPLVSIIIPAYNYARYLPEAVESALAQTYANCEVIVVDDESTDDTAEVLKPYGQRIRYVWQKNQGLSASRNTGIREARGDYLVFLDADDLLMPEMVAVSLAKLEELGEEFGIVANIPRLIDAEGALLADRKDFPDADREISTVDLLVMNRFSPNLLARKSAFEKVGGFDTALAASEDRDMWIRVSRQYRILRLADRLTRSRRHGANMSKHADRQSAAIRTVLSKAQRAGVLSGFRRILWLKAWSVYAYQSGLMYAGKNGWKSAALIAGSILLWPVHLDLGSLGQRPLFRLRSLAWSIRESLFKREQKAAAAAAMQE